MVKGRFGNTTESNKKSLNIMKLIVVANVMFDSITNVRANQFSWSPQNYTWQARNQEFFRAGEVS